MLQQNYFSILILISILFFYWYFNFNFVQLSFHKPKSFYFLIGSTLFFYFFVMKSSKTSNTDISSFLFLKKLMLCTTRISTLSWYYSTWVVHVRTELSVSVSTFYLIQFVWTLSCIICTDVIYVKKKIC